MKLLILISLHLFFITASLAQEKSFTRYDTLRGSINPLRSAYDVHFYSLFLKVDIENKTIAGYNEIFYTATTNFNKIQVDLFRQFTIDSIVHQIKKLSYTSF
jgi:hypothetical protein